MFFHFCLACCLLKLIKASRTVDGGRIQPEGLETAAVCLYQEFYFPFFLPFLGVVLCIPPTLIPFWWMRVDVLQDHMCL